MPLAAIVGHANLVQLLRRAVERGRVPQSLLFAGPEGVGKHATAVALAQAINCPRRSGGDGCGACPVCRRIVAGTFSDVVVLDKGTTASIGIDALRDRVLGPVGYRPFEGARRVFIIDPADEMTAPTQDALLKTLEEPPPSAILILVTAYPDSLVTTIRSRCRRLRFGALTDDEVRRVLVAADPRMDPADALRRASASGGSVERALAVDEAQFEDDRLAAVGLLRAAQRGDVGVRLKASAAFAQVEKKRRVREAASIRLAILASLVRDLAAIAARRDDVVANRDLTSDLMAMAPAFPAPRLVAAFAAVREAEVSLERNASPKTVADWLAVTM